MPTDAAEARAIDELRAALMARTHTYQLLTRDIDAATCPRAWFMVKGAFPATELLSSLACQRHVEQAIAAHQLPAGWALREPIVLREPI
ncbi:MAG: hypothetical protein NZX77_00735 [Polyangiaceae bacterium]|nr:hypothetical protein [Polyangiaceae bacterium]